MSWVKSITTQFGKNYGALGGEVEILFDLLQIKKIATEHPPERPKNYESHHQKEAQPFRLSLYVTNTDEILGIQTPKL